MDSLISALGIFSFLTKEENLDQAPAYWLIVLEVYCFLRIFRVPRLNPSDLNRPRLTEVKDSGDSANDSAAWAGRTWGVEPEKGGAEDVLGWDNEPEAGGSGSEGMGMSIIPTSSNRNAFFFFPLLPPSSERGNMTLEAVALALPLRPSGPKQGHSDKGLLEDPS